MKDQRVLDIINSLEKEAAKAGNPYWIISHETAEFLHAFIIKHHIKKVLEVGTSIGYSGMWIADALRKTGGKLYTIESHKGRFEKAKAHFQESGLSKYILQILGHAPDVTIPDMFDLLFLDATKAEHLSYLISFLFHMKKGGYILADNALTHGRHLQKYADYIFHSPQLESELIRKGDGIYFSRII